MSGAHVAALTRFHPKANIPFALSQQRRRSEQEAPELTRRGRRLFGGESAIGFLSTGARDARPRIAPVSPIFALHDLYLSIEKDTPKRFDLLNDGRYMLHAFLGKDDEEFQVPGRAALVSDAAERASVHAAITFQFQSADPIFALDLERCFWGYWENVGQPGTYPVKERWVAPSSGA
jgi:hypothetical protein